jgi:hypothetical protein
MFKMQDDFKAVDGYHVIEIHDKDEVFCQAVIEAMKVKGYDVYGFSDLGTSVQYNFVTAEFAEVLKERHHASCRNSASGIFELPTEAVKVNPQCISRAFRNGDGKADVKIVDVFGIDHQAYPDGLAALDTPKVVVSNQVLVPR